MFDERSKQQQLIDRVKGAEPTEAAHLNRPLPCSLIASKPPKGALSDIEVSATGTRSRAIGLRERELDRCSAIKTSAQSRLCLSLTETRLLQRVQSAQVVIDQRSALS